MSEQTIRRCAIYTRKSSENGLEQSFNSLDAQREACEAYIKSQAHEGWILRPDMYDDGGISGGHMDRPALGQLVADIKAELIDVVVVYKVDRLSRSLADFVKLVQLFDKYKVSFVSITQHFNTSGSMGRLTLNVLLSFAQFEREVTSERIRDKIAASKRKGMWMGGRVPLGYDAIDRQLIVNQEEADLICHIFRRYLALGCVRKLKFELDCQGYLSKARPNGCGSKSFSRGALYNILKNPLYIGKVKHKDCVFDGQHDSIVDSDTWSKTGSLLEKNRISTNLRSKAKVPSLLAGLLFDSNGNPMSPTHTKKNGRRYRYYVSQALLKYENDKAGSVTRVPAADIEGPVIRQIGELLADKLRLLQVTQLENAQIVHRRKAIKKGASIARSLEQMDSHNAIELLNRLVDKVQLSHEKLTVRIKRKELVQLLSLDAKSIWNHQTAEINLSSPIQLKRSGLETKMIIGDKSENVGHHSSILAIQNAVCDALRWSEALLSGKAKTVTELASEEGVSQRYLSSLMHLSFLAPNIVAAISKGYIPVGLTLEKLKRGFPLDWKEQHQLLGF